MLCENAGTTFDGFVVTEDWHYLRRDASGFSHLEGFGGVSCRWSIGGDGG
jgi:hypothetical protein